MVGGDWHDIVALPGGRVTLVVGDAMGHGPEAAAVMVQLPRPLACSPAWTCRLPGCWPGWMR